MIEVKNLSFSYNKKDKALENVSFTVNDHEWVSILGHNGSGKSTIAKLLIGLHKANSGEILYDGEKLSEETIDKIRSRVGIVFQNPDNQFVGFNVKYDIAFGLENHQVERS
jgi:energy-coupling factor transport system ATP-binding protein